MTTFDRYLLRRFLHVFSVGYIATFGLYVVIDGFTNVDSFQEQTDSDGPFAILSRMAEYYAYQSSFFFQMSGAVMMVVAVMVVLAMLQRNSELYPILSAGVPTYRLVVPLLVGTIAVTLGLIVNQELIIPRIAHHLLAPRGMDETAAQSVEPVYDHETRILIAGKELYFVDQKMRDAEFILPVPLISKEFTTLKAPEAFYHQKGPNQSSGWLLKGVSPQFHELKLSQYGAKVVLPREAADELFIATDVSFDQLNNRETNYRFLSTAKLMSQIRNPAYSVLSVRAKTLHLHERLTQPLMNIAAILLAVPLIVRKEGLGLVANLAICAGVLGLFFFLEQACLFLAKEEILAADLAMWTPIIISGTLCAWLSKHIQT